MIRIRTAGERPDFRFGLDLAERGGLWRPLGLPLHHPSDSGDSAGNRKSSEHHVFHVPQ